MAAGYSRPPFAFEPHPKFIISATSTNIVDFATRELGGIFGQRNFHGRAEGRNIKVPRTDSVPRRECDFMLLS